MTRRSPGEGTVYQRKDGKWVAEVQLPNDHLGRRHRRKRTANTKKQAEQLRRGLLADLEAGRIELDASVTVAEWCQHWLRIKPTLGPKARTVYHYRYVLDQWVLPHVGRYQLRELQVAHVEAMLTSLLDSGLSVSTAQQARRVLSSAMGHAARSRRISHNPVRDTISPRHEGGQKPPPESLTEPQAKQLLNVCASHPDVIAAVFTTLAVMLGMRRGEILGLRLGDIDWVAGNLSIRQTLNQDYVPTVDGGWVTQLGVSTPKTRHSRRTLRMPPRVCDALRRLVADRDQRQRSAGDKWEETGFLFCSRYGKPMWPPSLAKRFKRLLEDAELPPVAPHSLRHTFAIVCLLNEVPAEHVQEAAGHSSIRTTKDMYANYLPQLATKAIDALSQILAPNADHRYLRLVEPREQQGA